MNNLWQFAKGFITALSFLALLLYLAHPVTLVVAGLMGVSWFAANSSFVAWSCSGGDSGGEGLAIAALVLVAVGVVFGLYQAGKTLADKNLYQDKSSLGGGDWAGSVIAGLALGGVITAPWIFLPGIFGTMGVLPSVIATIVTTMTTTIPPLALFGIAATACTIIVTACIKISIETEEAEKNNNKGEVQTQVQKQQIYGTNTAKITNPQHAI